MSRRLHWHAFGRCIFLYREPRDRRVGYYRGPKAHYVRPLPTIVISWRRW